jgi:type IV pilus assembly protein PilC
MVKAGEVGGILDDVLLRIANQLEKDQEVRRKVKSAMTYPTVVLVLAILAASFISSLSSPSLPRCPRISVAICHFRRG